MATFGVQGNPPVGAWSTGLCDCCDDAGGCCLTFFCPCVTFGRIAGIVDQGATSCCASGTLYLLLSAVTGMGCLYSCCYRSKLRAQYGLTEKPCADCCVHWCCEPCALCQEYRELKARGFDMSIAAVDAGFAMLLSTAPKSDAMRVQKGIGMTFAARTECCTWTPCCQAIHAGPLLCSIPPCCPRQATAPPLHIWTGFGPRHPCTESTMERHDNGDIQLDVRGLHSHSQFR